MTRQRIRPSSEANAAVLAVVRAAGERLPDRHASHLDQLFALECAARAGTVAGTYVDPLRDAQANAEWWVHETWEPDVPHAAVLAQAMATRDALGQDAPAGWPERLHQALDTLAARRARFGLAGDPRLLAAVLRGLATIGVSPPDWLLDAAREAIDGRRGAAAQAELADALARHKGSTDLARAAAAAAFNGAGTGDPDAPYARWWLAARSAQTELPATFNPQVLADARRQSLAAAAPTNEHSAAMLLEAAGRVADELVIGAPSELADARQRLTRSQLLQLASYRGVLLLGAAVLALVFLGDLGGFASDIIGIRDELVARRVIAAAAVCGLFLAVTRTVAGTSVALGHNPPEWLARVETVGTVVAGIIGAASV